MEKMRMESPDGVQQNIDKIAALFPNCITETIDEEHSTSEKKVYKKAINFDTLRQMLSSDVLEGDEAYEFTWVGKKAAIVEANKPIRMTLRPCPEESVNWESTENLYIEGDNLDVLKLLQESYLGKIKLIYIDPPYNTGGDFIYNDIFAISEYQEQLDAGEIDEEGTRFTTLSRSDGRFHSKWLTNLYSRLLLCRNLISNDGLIFVSIDDNEQANLKEILDEIFGMSNFIGQFVWKSKPQGGNDNPHIVPEHEYILAYAKKISELVTHGRPANPEKYKNRDEYYETRGGFALGKLDLSTLGYRPNLDYAILAPDGTEIYPGGVTKEEKEERVRRNTNATNDWQWRWSKERFDTAILNGFIVIKRNGEGKWGVYAKEYQNVDRDGNLINRELKFRTIIDDVTTVDGTSEMRELLGNRVFPFPKPIELLRKFIKIGTDGNSIVMDFYSGSASTAHALMDFNAVEGTRNKFIMVQYPEETPEISDARNAGYHTICELGKERIRRAGKKIVEGSPLTTEALDIGFRVFKLDKTNMKAVYYAADEFTQANLTDMTSNIKEDRTSLDLLFGCLLEWGLPLSLPYTSEQIDGCTVHTYNDGDLIACFDENIPDSVIKTIARRQPLRAVFRDSSFINSPAKINVTEIFKLLAPDTRVKVL